MAKAVAARKARAELPVAAALKALDQLAAVVRTRPIHLMPSMLRHGMLPRSGIVSGR